MCLNVVLRNPKSLRFKNGRITLYKIVKNNNPYYLTTPYKRCKLVTGYNYARGIISSGGVIGSGAIHVFTNKKNALYNALTYRNQVVIPVICYKKDFIAKGNNVDACFTRIFITKKVYEQARQAKYKSEIVC